MWGFFMHYFYILYSPSAGKFYVGETADANLPLAQHNTHYFRGSFILNSKEQKKFDIQEPLGFLYLGPGYSLAQALLGS